MVDGMHWSCWCSQWDLIFAHGKGKKKCSNHRRFHIDTYTKTRLITATKTETTRATAKIFILNHTVLVVTLILNEYCWVIEHAHAFYTLAVHMDDLNWADNTWLIRLSFSLISFNQPIIVDGTIYDGHFGNANFYRSIYRRLNAMKCRINCCWANVVRRVSEMFEKWTKFHSK